VPIYWGASNISDYVDENAFIDRRKFKSNEELEAYLLSITEDQFIVFQNAMQDYLESEKFKKFLPEAFSKTVISVLNLN
jgi:hypothetical protein